MSQTTIVTGLWDLGRDQLTEGFSRKIDEYIDYLNQLIAESDVNILLYIPYDLEIELTDYDSTRLHIVRKNVVELRDQFDFSDKVWEIRCDSDWYGYADWLKDSPQAALPGYNIVTFSKYFLLHDATIHNPFNSKYFYWLDAGIARTLSLNYVRNELFDKIPNLFDVDNKLLFLSFPYTGNNEVHGFRRDAIRDIIGKDSEYVCRGGFFGGSKKSIADYNSTYYNLLESTLNAGYMGTEETIFMLMTYLYPSGTIRYDIGDSGLIYPFFQYVSDAKVNSLTESLYVLSFNSPAQFQYLLRSFRTVDKDFLLCTKKYLINNSTDETTFEEYDRLCSEYGFEEIHFDNIGINRARFFVAEHFQESTNEHYIFFEDDMLLNDHLNVCKSGFTTNTPALYYKSLEIMKKEELDFLKLSFSEFYGDNSIQFAWYNIPASIREKQFPDKPKLPISGLDPAAPTTKFDRIGTLNGLAYAIGQVYYCNWPVWFSKKGNQKVFFTELWDFPYEQTWMSHTFSVYLQNQLKSGVLLLSPINHHRFDFYPAEARREN